MQPAWELVGNGCSGIRVSRCWGGGKQQCQALADPWGWDVWEASLALRGTMGAEVQRRITEVGKTLQDHPTVPQALPGPQLSPSATSTVFEHL